MALILNLSLLVNFIHLEAAVSQATVRDLVNCYSLTFHFLLGVESINAVKMCDSV